MSGAAQSRPLKKGDHLYLIDGSGYLFRAYHALPPLTRKSDGLPTGAVSGYCNMLWKLLEDMKGPDQPSHLAVIFDAGAKTFRNDIYPAYKAHRPEPPEDLIPQFPLVRDATRAFNVACVEMANYEADDLIATYTRVAREAGARVTIVSSDKDLMQLVEDGVVQLLDTMKNKRIGFGRGDGTLRRAPIQGGGGAGAGRRFHRQCAGRARHRRQNGGGADQRLWRSGNAVREGRRRSSSPSGARRCWRISRMHASRSGW